MQDVPVQEEARNAVPEGQNLAQDKVVSLWTRNSPALPRTDADPLPVSTSGLCFQKFPSQQPDAGLFRAFFQIVLVTWQGSEPAGTLETFPERKPHERTPGFLV